MPLKKLKRLMKVYIDSLYQLTHTHQLTYIVRLCALCFTVLHNNVLYTYIIVVKLYWSFYNYGI